MAPFGNSAQQITTVIGVLQDALHKEAYDKKAVHSDVVKAANLLLELLGLPSVAPDTGAGEI